MSNKEYEKPYITPKSDLAYLQREFGTDALIDAFDGDLLDYPADLYKRISLYLLLTTGEGKNYKEAIVGDDPDNWLEETDT